MKSSSRHAGKALHQEAYPSTVLSGAKPPCMYMWGGGQTTGNRGAYWVLQRQHCDRVTVQTTVHSNWQRKTYNKHASSKPFINYELWFWHISPEYFLKLTGILPMARATESNWEMAWPTFLRSNKILLHLLIATYYKSTLTPRNTGKQWDNENSTQSSATIKLTRNARRVQT